MITIKIGGVPEHFNLPWYLTLKDGAYKKEGINLRWKDFYGGSGAMSKALRENEIDLAVILTEGIIKDINTGNTARIIQTYVESPLIWGIHVANNSNYNAINDLKQTKAAISRFGSGSHLMTYINAKNNNWNLETDLDFQVINNLQGAINNLPNGIGDYFLWEKFTTKPIVDNGVFRRIGECPSPWPCFVIAATQQAIENHSKELKIILEIINNTTYDFKNIPRIGNTISNRYEQQLTDVQEWLSITEWSQSIIDKKTINTVQNELYNLNIINTKLDYNKIIYSL